MLSDWTRAVINTKTVASSASTTSLLSYVISVSGRQSVDCQLVVHTQLDTLISACCAINANAQWTEKRSTSFCWCSLKIESSDSKIFAYISSMCKTLRWQEGEKGLKLAAAIKGSVHSAFTSVAFPPLFYYFLHFDKYPLTNVHRQQHKYSHQHHLHQKFFIALCQMMMFFRLAGTLLEAKISVCRSSAIIQLKSRLSNWLAKRSWSTREKRWNASFGF